MEKSTTLDFRLAVRVKQDSGLLKLRPMVVTMNTRLKTGGCDDEHTINNNTTIQTSGCTDISDVLYTSDIIASISKLIVQSPVGK